MYNGPLSSCQALETYIKSVLLEVIMDISSLLTHTESNTEKQRQRQEAGYKDDEMDGDSSHRAMQQGASAYDGLCHEIDREADNRTEV